MLMKDHKSLLLSSETTSALFTLTYETELQPIAFHVLLTLQRNDQLKLQVLASGH